VYDDGLLGHMRKVRVRVRVRVRDFRVRRCTTIDSSSMCVSLTVVDRLTPCSTRETERPTISIASAAAHP
jgi:hypothetical protein